jgi:uncharacterized protein involved in exopolysaccharide biosynthesis
MRSRGRFSRRRVAYLLEAPLRRRRLLVAPTLLVSLAAATLVFLLPGRYRAAALVRAEWDVGDDALLRRRGVDLADRRNQAVRQRVTERRLLERTLEQTTPYAGGRGPAAVAEQVERLRSDLRVRPMARSLFAVEFEHPDPVKASLVPNVLARLLVEEAESARRAAEAGPGRGPIARFELLADATLPATPESPDPVLHGLAGALVGLLLGLLAAVVAEHRDRSVKGPEDLEDILPVPLLATLPEVRGRDRQGPG